MKRYTTDDITFGIEFEFTGISRSQAAKVLSNYFGNSEVIYIRGNLDTYKVTDLKNRVWKIVKDGSIRPEIRENGYLSPANELFQCELVSPILRYIDIEDLQNLIRELRNNGVRTNSSTGVHIHIGTNGDEIINPKFLRNLCNIVYSKQELLDKALKVKDNRKRFCRDLENNFLEELNKKKPKTLEDFADIYYKESDLKFQSRNTYYHDNRYRALNLHKLLQNWQDTVEFRFFNSTVHAGKIKTYIQLSYMMVLQALNQNRTYCRKTIAPNENFRWSMRIFLIKLNMTGSEFKTARYILTHHLKGNSAFRDRVKEEQPF